MATYDNKYWLLNNIRNSFITEDKTLTCEEILGGDDFAEKCYQKLLKKSNGSEVFSSYHPYTYDKDNQDDDADLVYSFQIRPHDYMVLQWSNENVQTFTAHHNNTKTVEWRDPEPCTKNEDAILFPKKRLSILKDKDIEKKSLLAELLQNETELKQLRYQKYARFDGTGVVGVSTLNFKIFLKMGLDNMISTDVCIMSGTIYMDLIGLACYKFCLDNPNIILQSVNSYTLSVVDEDGEIFWGFSCLNPKSYCTEKYGHNLCLVENSATSKDTEAIEDKAGTSVTTVDSIEVQCRQDDIQNFVFMDMPIVLTYKVQMDIKNFNFLAQLKVSVEKIEIIPNRIRIAKIWNNIFDKKPMSLNLMSISWCEVIDTNLGRVLQLTYHPLANHEDCKPCRHYIVTKYYNFRKVETPLEEIANSINKAIEYIEKLGSN